MFSLKDVDINYDADSLILEARRSQDDGDSSDDSSNNMELEQQQRNQEDDDDDDAFIIQSTLSFSSISSTSSLKMRRKPLTIDVHSPPIQRQIDHRRNRNTKMKLKSSAEKTPSLNTNLQAPLSHQHLSTYDPFSPIKLPAASTAVSLVESHNPSLLDQVVEDEEETEIVFTTVEGTPLHPFLEMECDDDDDDDDDDHTVETIPLRNTYPLLAPQSVSAKSAVNSEYEPIRTTSGLLLTHRKTPSEYPKSTRSSSSDLHQHRNSFQPYRSPYVQRVLASEKLEVESSSNDNNNNNSSHSFYVGNSFNGNSLTFLHQARRLLTYARLGVVISAVFTLVGTGVLVHHLKTDHSHLQSQTQQHQHISGSTDSATNSNHYQSNSINRVVLLPLPRDSPLRRETPVLTATQQSSHNSNNNNNNKNKNQHRHLLDNRHAQTNNKNNHNNNHSNKHNNNNNHNSDHRFMADLRNQFDDWVTQHNKKYHTPDEKARRFRIWSDNHHEIQKKNQRHGLCRLTQQPVFGSNLFQDMTNEEFQSNYLTGYTGPTTDQLELKTMHDSGVLNSDNVNAVNRHPEVHRKLMEQWKQQPIQRGSRSYTTCEWYDVSCILQYLFEYYIYGIGGTMEPAYDSSSFPTSIDWRDLGAVSEIHSQGNCGACWAITAVETIESAVFIDTGVMYDLSETEVIVCADECELCYGGWPQEAFEYVMKNGGIPLNSDVAYDGDFLLEVTKVLQGESESMTESEVNIYKQQICPDKNSANSRYGNIKGYGYSTKKCVCYTDGSGCDCDSQNEGVAVRNVATYGPAVVCVDASEWKAYTGGVITSASGCSQKFMDVNHCVQVVGYAYAGNDNNSNNNNNDRDQGSHDNNGHDSGDNRSGDGEGGDGDDSGQRQGYWIVRNQWSKYWGYSGYAYVSMGENTCGILNDMIQVYT